MSGVCHFVLIPSPFLGPAVWEPVADRLRRPGQPVTVLDCAAAKSPADILETLQQQMPAGDDLVLVPHSNAGLYVASLGAERPVRGVVFVDAGLPSDAPTTPTAPAELRQALAAMAGEDSVLPPWTSWWAADEVAQLFPDPATRTAVERQQPRLPLSYLDSQVPTPVQWRTMPAAYLAFGDTYAPERATAEQRAWPVETLPGRHLHQLVDPGAVTEAILRLRRRLPRIAASAD